jgi:hypothetical protein
MEYPRVRKANPKRIVYQTLKSDSVTASYFQEEKRRDRIDGYWAYILGAVIGLTVIGGFYLIVRLVT